eukprot:c907_g1_i1.p1 GENE.c907_g1_i1~~c907_g1_i1.p1  ORF type:complete len:250 (+),score=55.85 c907_g1_i1:43-750(+)
MEDLLRRVELVLEATGGDPGKGDQENQNKDPFLRAKHDVHERIKAVRQSIKLRDELSMKNSSSPETIAKSQRIRNDLKLARDFAEVMRQELEKLRIRKTKNQVGDEELATREEQMSLVWKHIEECERLEKLRYLPGKSQPVPSAFKDITGDAGPSSGRSRLAADGGTSGLTGESYHPATNTELPPIEIQEQLQQLRERDRQLVGNIANFKPQDFLWVSFNFLFSFLLLLLFCVLL